MKCLSAAAVLDLDNDLGDSQAGPLADFRYDALHLHNATARAVPVAVVLAD